MALKGQNESEKSGELVRRGRVVYETNPSLVNRLPVRIRSSKASKHGDAYMVAPGTGEVIARGTFGFVEEEEVDSEQFVKIYLAGIRQYGQLSKAGALLFEFVYKEISGKEGKDRDTVVLNLFMAQRWKPDLARRTFFRGLNELVEKEFIYPSVAAETYFVNVRFMFNGDRMALVKSYRRKGSVNAAQTELPLELPDPNTIEHEGE